MKILVTGAGGFLGKAIVERLFVHGQMDVRCMLRDTSKARGLEEIAARYPGARLEFVAVNLRNAGEISAAVVDCEMVIHAAASLNGSPAEMFMDSVVASKNLLDAVANVRPMRMVLISSFGAMGISELRRGAMVDENTPMESHPEKRDVYAHSKQRQEQLFWEYRERFSFDLVVLRPGVIYGPGGSHFSNRVGLNLFGTFLHLGGNNLLPLTYVENCAEAIVVAALYPGASGQIYNVVDDDLVTSREYLSLYNKKVKPVRSLPVPYFALMWGSKIIENYSRRSKGQLPAIFTPYKTRAMWAGNKFSNAKLKGIGWRPVVSTRDGLAMAFAAFRAEPVKIK